MPAVVCAPTDLPQLLRCCSYRSAAALTDKYEVGPSLGQGGFSHVVRVTDKASGDDWACKITTLSPEKHSSSGFGGSTTAPVSRSAVVAEISAMAAAGQHPHIVQLHDSFEQHGKVYMVLEELRGGDLLLGLEQRGAYSETDTREVAFRVLDALRHLHHRNVVHRDIKLENLLLQRPGDVRSVKLADFGCAFAGSSLEETRCMTGVSGSPFYLAPEVVRMMDGRGGTTGTYGRECDMWALGVALYTMLAGRPPFIGASLPEILNNILLGSVDFASPALSAVSGPAKDLLRKLLTAEPKARLSAEDALRHPWFAMRNLNELRRCASQT